MSLRVVYFGNSESVFSERHFRALQDASCEIVAVVDVPPARRVSTNTQQPGNEVDFATWARAKGLPAFEPEHPNRADFVETLRRLRPDLFITVGYMSRLRAELLSVPALACPGRPEFGLVANFHASLLPAYRGKHPLFWALRAGERWSGLTVHAMDEDLDSGDILYQVRIRVRRDDSVAALYDRIMDRSTGLIGRLVADAVQGSLAVSPQGEAGASYFSSVGESDFRLDWARDAGELCRWIRTSPGACFADVNGERVYFLDAEALPSPAATAPGVVVKLGRSAATVATGQGTLRFRRVRRKDTSPTSMADWCRGRGLTCGASLSGT